MNRDLIEKLEHRLKELDKIIISVKKNLASLPSGSLRIHNRQGNTYYYTDCKGHDIDKRIPVYDKDLVCSLAQRSYDLKILRAAETEHAIIQQFLGRMPDRSFENIYESLPEARQVLIKPVRLTDKQLVDKWLKQPYQRKGFYEGDPFFETERGERVRSKSEQLIANRLYSRGIPYKYECPLLVGGEIIHPDFTILRLSDRKELYYEHLGKMGDEDYAFKTIRRINNYTSNGIILGNRLFTTMESNRSPLDLRILDIMIEENFR